MAGSDGTIDGLDVARQKAFELSFHDRIGSVLRKEIDILKELMKENADPKSLCAAVTTLAQERSLIEQMDNRSDSPFRALIYQLSTAIEITLGWYGKRDENRHSEVAEGDKEGFRDLFDVSDVEEEESQSGHETMDEPSLLSHNESPGDSEDGESDAEENPEIDDGDSVKQDANEKLRCKHCGYRSRRQSTLMYHVKIVHKSDAKVSRKYECEHCGRVYLHHSTLSRHRRIHRTENSHRTFECNLCGKVLTTSRGLLLHKRAPHFGGEGTEGKRYACDECGKRFAFKCHLKNHKIAHLPAEDPRRKRVECDICGKMLTVGCIQAHKKIHLDDEKSQINCDLCGATFRTKRHLKSHTNRIHAVDKASRRRFDCDVCGSRFVRMANLRRHKIGHLPDGDPRKVKYECDACGLLCANVDSLRCHEKTHLDAKPFKCQECKMAFRNIHHLKDHTSTHTREYAFKCQLCPRGFDRKHKLTTHMQRHEEGTVHEIEQCAECPIRVRGKHLLKKHMQKYHEGKYKCDLCNLRFRCSMGKAKHMLNNPHNGPYRRPQKRDAEDKDSSVEQKWDSEESEDDESESEGSASSDSEEGTGNEVSNYH